jgi:membrane protease subunit HflK
MTWDDKPGNNGKDKDRKNPWGRPGTGPQGGGGNKRPGGPFGGGGMGGGGRGPQDPPDLDEAMRRFNENFRAALPGNMQGLPIAGLGLIALGLLWLASGFYIVNPGEQAVVQRFGAWDRTKSDAGLGYRLPAPIESVSIVNVQEIRKLNIGFADEPFAGRGNATAKRAVPEESLMLTSDRNIVDLDLEVQWNIKNSEDFLFNVEDQEATIKKVAESAIREIVGQTPMFQIITNLRQQVADRTKVIIQTNLDEYKSGVNITQVLIQKAEVHPEVQDAFQDVQSAKQDAEDVQNRAQAYREDILPKARGQAIQMLQQAEAYKQATVAKAKGDADRFNSIYEAYLTGQDVTKQRIYIETMEEVLRNARKIIMDGNQSQGVLPYLPLNEVRPAAGDRAPKPETSSPEQSQTGLQ